MYKQRGMTFIGWLLVIGLVFFFAMIAIKLTPVYMEAYSVKTHLQNLKKEPNITKKEGSEIRVMLQRRFEIDDVRSVNVSKHVTISADGGVLKVQAKYSIRRNLFGNIDVIIDFDQKVEIVQN